MTTQTTHFGANHHSHINVGNFRIGRVITDFRAQTCTADNQLIDCDRRPVRQRDHGRIRACAALKEHAAIDVDNISNTRAHGACDACFVVLQAQNEIVTSR